MLVCTDYCTADHDYDYFNYNKNYYAVNDQNNFVCLSYDVCTAHFVNFFAVIPNAQSPVECEYGA